jgi:RNA polymerase sigma-70 factor (ECF subfamily)
VLALDSLDAEARYAVEPAEDMTPERLFDRRWALAVLDQVLARLRREFLDAGNGALFEAIKDCLTPDRGKLPYAQLARRLGMTEGALKVAVHRMRRRYRDLLRHEIAQTVETPAQVDEEIAYLLNCL